MNDQTKKIKGLQKQSVFGIISVAIGVFNGFFILYLIHIFTKWLIRNPEITNNPVAIDGMPVSSTIIDAIVFFIALQFIGIACGILGLIKKSKKKLLAIIGTSLNGLFLIFTIWKLT